MKNLVLAALLAAAASAGCTTTPNVTVTAHWSFKHITDGTARSCPVDYQTATVFAVPYDRATAQVNGNQFNTDLFDCDRFAGTILVPDGVYLMSVRIENDAGSRTYADSEQVFIDTAVDAGFDVEILDDGGYFQFRWTLKDAVSGARLSCAEAQVTGNASVAALSTSIATPSYYKDDKFTCEDHFGKTAGLRADSYTIAIDAEENNLGLGAAVNLTDVIEAPNVVTDLGRVEIPIDP
jgi:hypothetical protein